MRSRRSEHASDIYRMLTEELLWISGEVFDNTHIDPNFKLNHDHDTESEVDQDRNESENISVTDLSDCYTTDNQILH